MARVTTAKLEKFYELLAAKRVPFIQGRLHVNLSTRSSYVYQARRNGIGVKLNLNFMPGSDGWEKRFRRALAASIELLFERTSAIEIRLESVNEWPDYIAGPFRRLNEDLARTRKGYYLPKEVQQWKGLLGPGRG